MTTATYAKLRDGSWGMIVVGDCSPGMQVTAVRRDGKEQAHVIGAIVWAKDGKFGCTIATAEQAAKLAARPNHDFDPRIHVTYPVRPIPPDDGSIPFDPPYARRRG